MFGPIVRKEIHMFFCHIIGQHISPLYSPLLCRELSCFLHTWCLISLPQHKTTSFILRLPKVQDLISPKIEANLHTNLQQSDLLNAGRSNAKPPGGVLCCCGLISWCRCHSCIIRTILGCSLNSLGTSKSSVYQQATSCWVVGKTRTLP